MEETGPRVVFVAVDNYEVQLVKSLLEGSGIAVYTQDEHLCMSQPFGIALGGIKLIVSAEDEPFAREVLEAYRGRTGEDEPEAA